MKSPIEHPPYARECQRLAELRAQLEEKEQRRAELRIYVERHADEASRLAPVEKLAAGQAVSVSSLDATRSEIANLTAEIRVLMQAIELVKQRQSAALSEASRIACEAAREQHREKVRAVINAVTQLAIANEAEHAVRQKLEVAGFNGYLPPLSFAYVGMLQDYSGAAAYLCEAVEHGYLSREDFKKLTGGRITPPPVRVSAAEVAKKAVADAARFTAGWCKLLMKKTLASPEITLPEKATVILPEAKARPLLAEGLAEQIGPPTPDELRIAQLAADKATRA